VDWACVSVSVVLTICSILSCAGIPVQDSVVVKVMGEWMIRRLNATSDLRLSTPSPVTRHSNTNKPSIGDPGLGMTETP
jgi:hypothetical protein